jgi:hypothetical protein
LCLEPHLQLLTERLAKEANDLLGKQLIELDAELQRLGCDCLRREKDVRVLDCCESEAIAQTQYCGLSDGLDLRC